MNPWAVLFVVNVVAAMTVLGFALNRALTPLTKRLEDRWIARMERKWAAEDEARRASR